MAGRESAATGEQPSRDVFLDSVRAVATIRVVLWHMLGFAVISYLFAAIPAMFFVSGSLLAASARRRPATTVVRDRLRRLFLPLWVFAVVAWALMTIEARSSGTEIEWSSLLAWFVPLVDPSGTPWEGGWLSGPLWFIRALLWLLLLSPILLRLVDRFGTRVLAFGAAGVVIADLMGRSSDFAPSFQPRLWWYLGDLLLYGTFFAAGFLHERGAFRTMSARAWMGCAVGAACLAVVWRVTQPVPDGVVNNSHPLHLLVGAAWLALAFAGRPIVEWLARRRYASTVVAVLSRRSFTVYLWHTLVLLLVLEVLEQYGSGERWINDATYVTWSIAGIITLTLLFGWIEDLAARRRASLWPARLRLRAPVIAGISVVCAVTVVVVQPWSRPTLDADAAVNPPVQMPRTPSQQPPPPDYEPTPQDATVAVAAHVVPAVLPSDTLRSTVRAWAREHEVPGLEVGVASPTTDDHWVTAFGTTPEGREVGTRDRFDLASITKLFTANLVLRAVDSGLLELDAPLPALETLPDFPYTPLLTVRQLLAHQSGLTDFRFTPQYVDDPDSITSPVDALQAVGREPLRFAPGKPYFYTSSNYFVLGLLLEQVTGRAIDEQLEEDVFAPLRLRVTSQTPDVAGAPHGGAAGIVTDVRDLLTAGTGLLRDHVGVSATGHEVMTAIDPVFGLGNGAMGFCPCTVDSDGVRTMSSIGHFGSSTVVVYVPSRDVVVAVNVTDDLWTDPTRFDAVTELIVRLADVVGEASAQSVG